MKKTFFNAAYAALNTKTAITVAVSLACGIGIGSGITNYCCQKHPKPSKNGNTLYVFCSLHGRPLTLLEKDVYSMKEMFDDGVQPSAIAEKFGLTPTMVCRVINS